MRTNPSGRGPRRRTASDHQGQPHLAGAAPPALEEPSGREDHQQDRHGDRQERTEPVEVPQREVLPRPARRRGGCRSGRRTGRARRWPRRRRARPAPSPSPGARRAGGSRWRGRTAAARGARTSTRSPAPARRPGPTAGVARSSATVAAKQAVVSSRAGRARSRSRARRPGPLRAHRNIVRPARPRGAGPAGVARVVWTMPIGCRCA